MSTVSSTTSPQLGVAAEALSTQHEHLLNEVEAAEGQLGAILRYVYCSCHVAVIQSCGSASFSEWPRGEKESSHSRSCCLAYRGM